MNTPFPEVNYLHAKVQKEIIKKGVGKVAMVITSALTNMTVNNIGSKPGMKQLMASFKDIQSAQKWLDE